MKVEILTIFAAVQAGVYSMLGAYAVFLMHRFSSRRSRRPLPRAIGTALLLKAVGGTGVALLATRRMILHLIEPTEPVWFLFWNQPDKLGQFAGTSAGAMLALGGLALLIGVQRMAYRGEAR